MDFSTLDIITFVGFLLFVIGVSLYASRKEENSEDYFLAGRGLSWWVIGLSLIASNISTEHFIGMAGQGYKGDIGLAIASYEWIAAGALVIVAIFLLPRFLKAGIYTIPEYLELRFNHQARMVMSIFMLIFYVTVTMAVVLFAGAFALKTIFNWPIYQGVWVIGITAGLYTVYGGLKAVVWSDVMQGTTLVIGGIIVTILGFQEMGGVERFFEVAQDRLHTILPHDHPELPWTAVLIGGMWIPNLFYWGLQQFITQRTLAAKSIEDGQKGILFGATIKLIIPFIIVFPGIMAFHLYADQIDNGDAAFPVLLMNVLPVGFIGVILAALFGATMSTLDSLLNSAATIFTMDIYKPYFGKSASPHKLVDVGRITTVILVLLACIWAPIVGSFEGGLYKFIQLYWGFIQCGVVAVFFLGIVWKRVPPSMAIAGMLLNVPVYGVLLYLFPETSFLHHMGITFVIILVLMTLGTLLLTKPGTRYELKIPEERKNLVMGKGYRLSGIVKVWSLMIVFATIALYIIFA